MRRWRQSLQIANSQQTAQAAVAHLRGLDIPQRDHDGPDHRGRPYLPAGSKSRSIPAASPQDDPKADAYAFLRIQTAAKLSRASPAG